MGNCCRKSLKDDPVTIGETSNVVDEIIEEVISELNKIPA